MTAVSFAYWLQGFFEISSASGEITSLNEKQVKMIRAHLNLIFKHDIDPKIDGDNSDTVLINQLIHDGFINSEGKPTKPNDSTIKPSDIHIMRC